MANYGIQMTDSYSRNIAWKRKWGVTISLKFKMWKLQLSKDKKMPPTRLKFTWKTFPNQFTYMLLQLNLCNMTNFIWQIRLKGFKAVLFLRQLSILPNGKIFMTQIDKWLTKSGMCLIVNNFKHSLGIHLTVPLS